MDTHYRICISESSLIAAAHEGNDNFIRIFTDAYWQKLEGEITADNIQRLTSDQLTLLGFVIMRDEVMEGGFIQLIHNGYGPFFFDNPFAKSLKIWGLRELSKLMYALYPLYKLKCGVLTKPCTEDEFMALFEQHSEFDEYDDAFIENEEEYTNMVAHYVDDHLDLFAEIIKD